MNKFTLGALLSIFLMKVSFRGGLEEYMAGADISLCPSLLRERRVKELILHIHNNIMDKDYQHFSKGDELEGGILCVINDKDWEVLEGKETEVSDEDHIYFITSMHGG